MSAESPFPPRPEQRAFASRSQKPRLSRDQADRQGRITHLAFALLGGRDEAISFLNTYCPALKARPIDLAMKNGVGYSAVENRIRLQAHRC